MLFLFVLLLFKYNYNKHAVGSRPFKRARLKTRARSSSLNARATKHASESPAISRLQPGNLLICLYFTVSIAQKREREGGEELEMFELNKRLMLNSKDLFVINLLAN